METVKFDDFKDVVIAGLTNISAQTLSFEVAFRVGKVVSCEVALVWGSQRLNWDVQRPICLQAPTVIEMLVADFAQITDPSGEKGVYSVFENLSSGKWSGWVVFVFDNKSTAPVSIDYRPEI